jgi:hypothetical protein
VVTGEDLMGNWWRFSRGRIQMERSELLPKLRGRPTKLKVRTQVIYLPFLSMTGVEAPMKQYFSSTLAQKQYPSAIMYTEKSYLAREVTVLIRKM